MEDKYSKLRNFVEEHLKTTLIVYICLTGKRKICSNEFSKLNLHKRTQNF